MPPLELVIDAHAALGEGPIWDAQSRRLYWVDISQNALHFYEPGPDRDRILTLPQFIGAVTPRDRGGVVVALQEGFFALDLDTQQLQLLARPDSHGITNRFNDGKTDAAGRFWAGTTSLQGHHQSAHLFCLNTDLTVEEVLNHVSISNGLGWSPDNRIFYYIDTPTRSVDAFDFDLASGHISHRRTLITIPADRGVPDGMTVDAQGMIWVAHWEGHQVSRWDPHTHQLLQVVEIPVSRVTSCTFGGDDLRDLYITTAQADSPATANESHAGGVFRLRTEVEGLPNYAFLG